MMTALLKGTASGDKEFIHPWPHSLNVVTCMKALLGFDVQNANTKCLLLTPANNAVHVRRAIKNGH